MNHGGANYASRRVLVGVAPRGPRWQTEACLSHSAAWMGAVCMPVGIAAADLCRVKPLAGTMAQSP